jgi:hypothetical protein
MNKKTIRAAAIIVQGLLGANSLQAYNWVSLSGGTTANQTNFSYAFDSAYSGDTQTCWTKTAFSAATARQIYKTLIGSQRGGGTDPNYSGTDVGNVTSYVHQYFWSANTHTSGFIKLEDINGVNSQISITASN